MTSPPIEHGVVLMLANRSFDHMLGWRKPAYGRRAFEGLTGREWVPLEAVTYGHTGSCPEAHESRAIRHGGGSGSRVRRLHPADPAAFGT